MVFAGCVLVIVGAFAALAAYSSARTGKISASILLRGRYARHDRPAVYWSLVAVDVLFSVAALLTGAAVVIISLSE